MKNNKLIAEFMGCTNPFNEIHDATLYKVEQGTLELDELQYHTSWDWLMPVCQKIDKYLEDNISLIGYFDDCLKSNDIDVRYQSVVEFINNQLN
ncbi:hypothetical protein N9P25_02010 [Flavobacteriaceae bacterium]|nr:hypothetical protein [Flavobacteriaceae bacterium]